MPSPSPKPAKAAPEGDASALRRCRPALGTLVDLHLSGLPAPQLARALDGAFREIARCERALSAHSPDNDLARLRAARPGALLTVDARVVAVLRRAATLARRSGGVFDPRRRVGPDEAVFENSFRLLPGRRVRVLAPLDLDLGGIAKGYAIDRAHAVLRRARVPAFVLNAGGDLRAHGVATRLVLRPPSGRGIFRELGVLRAGASATSAQTFRPHLRDPRANKVAARGRSFVVLAATAVLADALTKIVALAPAEAASRVLAHYRAHAAIVDSRGRLSWLSGSPPETVFSDVT